MIAFNEEARRGLERVVHGNKVLDAKGVVRRSLEPATLGRVDRQAAAEGNERQAERVGSERSRVVQWREGRGRRG
jgi:hypothetical protein